jgi:hypothetical protein
MEELIDKIFEELKCKHNISKNFIRALLEATKKFDLKQDIYETDNISSTGEIGILTRIGDAFFEIKKYLQVNDEKRSELQLTKEKILKDFIDVGVYGVIGYLYISGKWS